MEVAAQRPSAAWKTGESALSGDQPPADRAGVGRPAAALGQREGGPEEPRLVDVLEGEVVAHGH